MIRERALGESSCRRVAGARAGRSSAPHIGGFARFNVDIHVAFLHPPAMHALGSSAAVAKGAGRRRSSRSGGSGEEGSKRSRGETRTHKNKYNSTQFFAFARMYAVRCYAQCNSSACLCWVPFDSAMCGGSACACVPDIAISGQTQATNSRCDVRIECIYCSRWSASHLPFAAGERQALRCRAQSTARDARKRCCKHGTSYPFHLSLLMCERIDSSIARQTLSSDASARSPNEKQDLCVSHTGCATAGMKRARFPSLSLCLSSGRLVPSFFAQKGIKAWFNTWSVMPT